MLGPQWIRFVGMLWQTNGMLLADARLRLQMREANNTTIRTQDCSSIPREILAICDGATNNSFLRLTDYSKSE